MKSNEERLQDLLAYVDSLTRVHPSEIPGIDLYMDQVTTFMDSHLNTSKWLGEDKILTKTMINNYAKNNLLPPPAKKRYSKNHLLMLILIYYFKNVISFRDIEQLFSPISEHHFSHGSSPELEELYNEIFSLEKGQRKRLQEDVMAKFDAASQTFKDYDCEDREYLQLFAFISELAFDVYLKKQMIEILAEQLRQETPVNPKKKKEAHQNEKGTGFTPFREFPVSFVILQIPALRFRFLRLFLLFHTRKYHIISVASVI